MRVFVVLVWLLASACGRTTVPDATQTYESARTAVLRGDLQLATALTTQALDAVTADARATARLHLLQAEIALMRRDVDGASPLIDAPLPSGPGFEPLEARRLYLAGYRQVVRGDIAGAVTTLDTAMARASAAGAADIGRDAANLAGQALLRLGRFTDADARLLAARQEARAAGDHLHESLLLGTLGMGQLVRERYDAALGWFEQALAFREFDTYMSYAAVLSNAGLCYARLGEFDRALALQQRAVLLHEARNVPAYLEQALGELGHTHLLRGDAVEAVELLGRAREVAMKAGRSTDAALWLDSSAAALIDLQRWGDADRLNEEAVTLKRQPGASLAPNLINRAQIAQGRAAYDEAITGFRAALADDEAPLWVQWQAHAGLGSVFIGTGRTDEGLRQFEQALAAVDGIRSTLLEPEYRITFLSRMMHFYRVYVDALVDARQPQRALEVADASRARVLAERHGASPGARLSASALVTRTRRAGATAVAYWLGPARSFAWIVDGRGVRLVPLPPAAEIDRLVAAHRAFIERSLGDPRRVSSAPGDALAAAVLAPVLPYVPTGGRVIVVPDGSLHGVNLETLPVGADRRYWIEDVTITVAPALALAGAPHATPPPSSMLLVGDALDAGQGLGRLQYASAEIDGIRQAFAHTPMVIQRGADASPRAFLAGSPGRFSAIHFTAHATPNAQSPLDSSIELSPGPDGIFKLYARDIAQLALGADLVTISACRSAGDRAYSGEGLVGLAWAFMRAGAGHVVAGLWDVDDQSTATLMTDTYTQLASGLSPADALRAAKLHLIAAGGNFAKPYYWAPFQVFVAR